MKKHYAYVDKAFDKYGERKLLMASAKMNRAFEEWGAQKFCNVVNEALRIAREKVLKNKGIGTVGAVTGA
jgi:hypothetical protein